jgi:uncharacterized membrane protein
MMTDFRFRRLVIGLLGFNTFLLCAFAGAGLVYVKLDMAPSAARLPLAGEQLAKEDRDGFQQALSNARKAVRDQTLAARQARIEAAAQMGEEHLDANALQASLDQARDAEYQIRKATEEAAVKFASALPLEARRRLAQGLLGREAPKPATK